MRRVGAASYRTKSRSKSRIVLNGRRRTKERVRVRRGGQTDGSVRQARPNMHHRLWELGNWAVTGRAIMQK